MNFVKGMLIGSIISAGLVIAYNETRKENDKKIRNYIVLYNI